MHRGNLALLPRTRKGLVLFWTALFVFSMALQYAAAAAPKGVLAKDAFCDSFSIQTSDVNGGPVNQNHYGSKPEVYLQGGPDSGEDTLPAGTLVYYQVQEPNGDPLMEIRSVAIGADGTFRVQLAPFETTSNPGGEYKVVASTDPLLDDPGCTKSDNFKVDDPGTLVVTKTVEGGESDGTFPFTVDCGIAGDFAGSIPDGGSASFEVDALAECTVTEGTLPAPPAGFTWGAPTYTGNPGTVQSEETTTIGIVNHLNEIPPPPAPGLAIEKSVSLSADGPWSNEVTTTIGTEVFYNITVTNTGNVELTDVTLEDNLSDLVAEGCTIPTTLAVGGSFDCAYSNNAVTGTTVNTATADSEETGPEDDDATVIAAPTPPAPALTIDKTNNAPLVILPGTTTEVPQAPIGSTVTYTLSYTVTGTVSGATIEDVLPVGVTYVANSATSNADFTFDGYNAGTRTLSWSAAGDLTASGSVSYQATVDAGANNLPQPLVNVATIDSDDTDPDNDDSTVFVPAPVLAETSVPTAPRTDVLASGGSSAPGLGMGLVLLALVGLIFAIAFVTPVPASIRGRINRR